jgi:hypothetical protein
MRNKIYLVTKQTIECSLSDADSHKLREMYTNRMNGASVDSVFTSNPHYGNFKNVYELLTIDVREIAAIISPADGDSI